MSKWKNVSLTIAIAIIFVLFIGFGIETFYSEPTRDDFCDNDNTKEIYTEETCLASDGKWNSFPDTKVDDFNCKKIEELNNSIKLECSYLNSKKESGYCNVNAKCAEEYNLSRENYNKNLFVICMIIGLVAIIAGGLILIKESVGTGILIGGVLTVIYGLLRNWNGVTDILRFILLGIILSVLIWLAYKNSKK